ncbi:carboxylesterase [Salinisphaera orenii YIM 95161]|uniref:Carboxylic ester hydrolase n=2 Tax=Salinisphaera TaxID=180541 RepID=A0A423Q3L6_9GAMM|nr:carboxylesterase [Salinisphaera halophila YIM 95161]
MIRTASPWLTALLLAGALVGCSDDDDSDADIADGGDGADRTAVIETTAGPVRGRVESDVDAFLGIPYAAPPVGELRWRPPESPDAWTDTLDAVAFGNTCAQTLTLGVFAAPSQDEDCLFLNVFAPADRADGAALPVIVWMHGGAILAGGGNDYDGTKLARDGDVIVVTINNRMNVFGFLALPGLDSDDEPFGNYGFMDQQFAFEWVRDNIPAFGGDPDNVTLSGESAGGKSVWVHLSSPTAAGLFDRAIIQSGAGPATVDRATAEADALALAEATDCDSDDAAQTVACLRSLSVAEIQAAGSFGGNPVIDGTLITQPLLAAFQSGDFNQVPVIGGATRDENRFFVAVNETSSGQAVTAEQYRGQIESGYGDRASDVLDAYPLDAYDSPSLALSAVQTDSGIVCPGLQLDRALAQHVPVYIYEFADRTAPVYAPPVSFDYGAYHTGEIQYLFPLFRGATGTAKPLNEAQAALSDDMVSYWTAFAATADPNSSATPDWPAYSEDSPRYQSLELPEPVTRDVSELSDDHHCDLWAAVNG